MTRRQIENVADEKGWQVDFGKQPNHYTKKQNWVVEFTSYTSFGQNIVVAVVVSTLDEVPNSVSEYYESYDPDYEASLWIGEDGHGRNGAPYHIRDIVKDMDEADSMIEDLAIALHKI